MVLSFKEPQVRENKKTVLQILIKKIDCFVDKIGLDITVKNIYI